MKVENSVYPSVGQIMPLANDPTPGPIAMVNLLKFREKAEYPDGRDPHISGREAYMRYGVAMQRVLEENGARMIFSGDVKALVIGEVEDLWDAAAVVEYPSRAAFHRIALSSEVQAIGIHREAGLAGQLLIMSTGMSFPTS